MMRVWEHRGELEQWAVNLVILSFANLGNLTENRKSEPMFMLVER